MRSQTATKVRYTGEGAAIPLSGHEIGYSER
jgi:hypothetical protein